jgi:hypothetical protein
MSIAAQNDTRIDFKLATFLLVAVISFAFGIGISLVVEGRHEAAPPTPCPTHCPRVMLMSTKPPAHEDRCEMPVDLPSGFEPASVSAAP